MVPTLPHLLSSNNSSKGYAAPQHQVIKHTSKFQTPTASNQNVQRLQAPPNTLKDPAERRCFNYGEKGHFTHVCPKLQLHPNQMLATNLSPNRGANSVPMTDIHNLASGRVNQVAMTEAQDTLMTGIFLINFYSVLTIP
jgi:hypothetical protein